MKLSNQSNVPVYTISGSSTARPLPEWLARKRKRSLKHDPEYASRVELLQDFEFDEASCCIRASEDGDWVVSTGTYKPQIHVHYLPHLSLSYARHTDTLNQTFQLLSSDYSKQLHLQADRTLEFHTPSGCHYTTRIPRYGRDLKFDKRSAEALIPSVGLNEDGNGEVFRLNLEVGRFMKAYDIDVGGDDSSLGPAALQGGVNTGSVNVASIAEESHNLLAFGTSLGTVEFWDSRSRSRVGLLPPPHSPDADAHSAITALQFSPSGLNIATGSSQGLIYQYDLRSPSPLLKKDQGYGYPIQTLIFLSSSGLSSRNAHLASDPKILSADKRIIKIWDVRDGSPWTSVEPAVDLHCVEWCKDSGMFLTANEGRQQHSFFIPQLGPAPRWCSFLDNLVEEMAEDSNDPNAFGAQKAGEVYDNYKFLSTVQLRQLNLDHLIGSTSLLRPYMHGYFVNQQLYEEARLISNPDLWQEQRQKSIREKIDKERQSRIRGTKKELAVKVNRKLAERILERDEQNKQRKAKRALEKADVPNAAGPDLGLLKEATDAEANDQGVDSKPSRVTPLNDPRFAALFQDEDFAIDENSREFQMLNPGAKPSTTINERTSDPNKRLTAAEREELEEIPRSSGEEDGNGSASDTPPPQYRNQQKQRRDKTKGASARLPQMHVSSSASQSRQANSVSQNRDRARSFGSRAANASERRPQKRTSGSRLDSGTVGEKSVTFTPSSKRKGIGYSRQGDSAGTKGRRDKDRRSASNNVIRGL